MDQPHWRHRVPMRFSSLKPQGLLRLVAQHLLVLSMACLNLSFFSCRQALGDGDSTKQMSGILIGTMTKGPISPVIEPNVVYPPVPVEGVKVIITSLTDKRSASAITDKGGNFRIVLLPGTYQVTLGQLSGGAFSKDVPATITIRAGLETRMAIHLDTGIR
jgi:Carboxypeptidase regulatory-like domain